jgi:hypothetical protein
MVKLRPTLAVPLQLAMEASILALTKKDTSVINWVEACVHKRGSGRPTLAPLFGSSDSSYSVDSPNTTHSSNSSHTTYPKSFMVSAELGKFHWKLKHLACDHEAQFDSVPTPPHYNHDPRRGTASAVP